MSIQLINVGTTANDGTGDTARAAFTKCNANFTFLTTGSTVNLTIATSTITYGNSGYILYDNGGVVGELPVTGTGNVVLNTNPALSGVTLTGSTINGLTVGSTSAALNITGSYNLNLTLTGNTTLTLPTSGILTALGNASTGSGSVVLSTSPTLVSPTLGVASATQLTLAAGTTSVAPVVLTSGSILTSATAGALEYDGSVGYFTNQTASRGVIQADQWIWQNATYTLTSTTAAQKLFNASANGALTIPAGKYLFQCVFALASLSSSSADISFGIGGTATVTYYAFASATKAANTFASAASNVTYISNAATSIVPASTNTNAVVIVKGMIYVSVAGTVIPQVTLGAAAAAVVQPGSYCHIWPSSPAASNYIGAWT